MSMRRFVFWTVVVYHVVLASSFLVLLRAAESTDNILLLFGYSALGLPAFVINRSVIWILGLVTPVNENVNLLYSYPEIVPIVRPLGVLVSLLVCLAVMLFCVKVAEWRKASVA